MRFSMISLLAMCLFAPLFSYGQPKSQSVLSALPENIHREIEAVLAQPARPEIKFTDESTKENLSSLEREFFLRTTPIVPASDNLITVIAEILTAHETSSQIKVQRIHDFVVLHMNTISDISTSELDRFLKFCRDSRRAPGTCPWENAQSGFYSGIGHCGTFAALVVALLRAAGFPSRIRQVDALAKRIYAEENNGQWMLHQWSEVFLNGKWRQLDSIFDDDAKTGNINYTYFLFEPENMDPRDYIHRNSEVQDETKPAP